jgi:hypothetical protein
MEDATDEPPLSTSKASPLMERAGLTDERMAQMMAQLQPQTRVKPSRALLG